MLAVMPPVHGVLELCDALCGTHLAVLFATHSVLVVTPPVIQCVGAFEPPLYSVLVLLSPH